MNDVFAVADIYWIGLFLAVFLAVYIIRLAQLGHLVEKVYIKLDVAINALVFSLLITIVAILVYAYA